MRSVRLRTSVYKSLSCNMTRRTSGNEKTLPKKEEEEEDGGKSENETEREAFKNADEYDKDDVSEADDTPDE